MSSKLRALSRYRPRALTVLVLAVIAALLVLANLSDDFRPRRTMARAKNGQTFLPMNQDEWPFDVSVPDSDDPQRGQVWNVSYGWPLLWNQYVATIGYGPVAVARPYSPARLALNAAIWLLILALPAVACEWLLRRYHPRFRWSLRTMLVTVALLAAFCGWFAWARDRANREDALTEAIATEHGEVYFERWGPRWLDVIGADRYRRRIVAAELVVQWPDLVNYQNSSGERLLKRLAELHNLQFLVLRSTVLTSDVARALGDLRQLRGLRVANNKSLPEAIDDFGDAVGKMPRLRSLQISPGLSITGNDEQINARWLAAVAKAPQIENLQLSRMTIRPDGLKYLSGLTNLKSLTLDASVECYDESGSAVPAQLSALPNLAKLALECVMLDDDLRFLARFRHLKSLSLMVDKYATTPTGIQELASLQNLEELTVHGGISVEVLEALPALLHLKKLHIGMQHQYPEEASSPIELVPVVGDESEPEQGVRALETLRKARPGIVIEANGPSVREREQALIPVEYDTANRLHSQAVREAIRQWKAAGRPAFPPGKPTGGGMF